MGTSGAGLLVCAFRQHLGHVLAEVIAAAQGGDALAPVHVVVSGALAGVTLRRAAAGPGGLANVRFGSILQLADWLSARHLALATGPSRRRLTGEDRADAVRRVLDGGTSMLFAAAARHPGTAALLVSVLAELDDAEVDTTIVPTGLSPGGAEILELYRRYRAQLGGLLTAPELLDLAAECIASGAAPAGQVIVVADGALTAAEKRFLVAVHAADRLSAVLPAAHRPETAAWLRDLFSATADVGDAGVQQSLVVERLIVAPDAEEEVRLAVRRTMEYLAAYGCRPERIGIAYRAASPYLRLLTEQLTVAGVPHHAPSHRTLAQTLTGATIFGLLAVYDRGFPRPDLLRWMAGAPVLDAVGHRVLVQRWDRISRVAGVSGGLDSWRSQLIRYAEDQRGRAAELGSDAQQQDSQVGHEKRALDALALLGEVERWHTLTAAALTAETWSDAAENLLALLVGVLGKRRTIDGWQAGVSEQLAPAVLLEQDAHDAVADALHSLSESTGPVTAAAVVGAVERVLSAAIPSGTTLGRGVFVAPLASFGGADLDLLLVLGVTEESVPARQRENTVLRDADRTLLSPNLPTVASRRADERQQWWSALSAARTVHLSYPRADTRAQRRQFPSPWFLEQARRLDTRPGGVQITAAQVDRGEIDAPWFTSHDSFDASLRLATGFASAHELDVAYALHGRVDELAATDPRLRRGLAAARSRARGEFTEWAGNTGPLPEPLLTQVDARLSATNLQTWATCPTSHLYGRVLGIRDLEDRAAGDTIDARDKGTLVHGVLEALVAGHLGTATQPGISPDTAWDTTDITEAIALLDTRAAALTEHGLTGREVLWTAQLARLRRALVRQLANDSDLRRTGRSWPVAVEGLFGRGGVPALELTLPTQGTVSFAGSVDRIDVTEAGALVVTDYKTGKAHGFDSIPMHSRPDPTADLVDHGRKLQLVLYSLAARQLLRMPAAKVQAWFWFVEHGDLRRGGPVDLQQESGLTEALDVMVGGIRAGLYPANPGEQTWRPTGESWENCRYCAFDRVCPTTRAEQWTRQRTDTAVRPYAALVDTEVSP